MWEAILLGAIQGVFMFVPVSSTSHLTVAVTGLIGLMHRGVERAAGRAVRRAARRELRPGTRAAVVTVARATAVLAATLATTGPAAAQQFVTDDAGLVDLRACQLEAWHGQTGSWLLPACRPFSNLEITVGIGLVEGDRNGRELDHVLQLKTLFLDPQPGVSLGMVAGLGLDPLAQANPTGRRVSGVFVYMPATFSIANDRLLLHANIGWQMERSDDGRDAHALLWALRTDLPLGRRFTAIAELFGDTAQPGYQIGLRAGILADFLAADISHGGRLGLSGAGAGWAIGLALTPPPLR